MYWRDLTSLDQSRSTPLCLIISLQLLILCMTAEADSESDKQGLISFMNAVDVNHVLTASWRGGEPCTSGWIGVQCNKGRVWNLILESKQLQGPIPDGTLSKLDQLRKLSLKDNMLSGNLPTLSSPFLRAVWLQNNQFQGPISYSFSELSRFNVLDLAHNHLTGQIPASLASLPDLRQLNLEDNSITGSIPAFNQPSLKSFNVSDNQLSGEIPDTYVLQHIFGLSSYMNNPKLCGRPLNQTCNEPKSKGPLSTKEIAGIVAGDFTLLLLVTLAFFWYYRKKYKKVIATQNRNNERATGRKERHKKQMQSQEQDEYSVKDMSIASAESLTEKSKMVIVNKKIRQKVPFEIDDLLRASAELLGTGGLGTSYKASLEEKGLTVTVKRLGKSFHACKKKEFEQQMQLLGGLKHPNLTPLLAYYYAKDEKLLVYSYMPNSSLFSLLHGNDGQDRTSLDWPFRLKIAQSMARGLYYLYEECKAQKLPHGNMKSSNVLFDADMEPRLADYGMAPLIEASRSSGSSIKQFTAFTTPEYLSLKKLSRKADVYGFGIVLLELLTRKQPPYYTNKEGFVELPGYVGSAPEEEWTSEVFDPELETSLQNPAHVEGMTSVLKIAMDCVKASPDERPKMSHVYRRIEEVKRSSSAASPLETFHLNLSSDEGTEEQEQSARRSSSSGTTL